MWAGRALEVYMVRLLVRYTLLRTCNKKRRETKVITKVRTSAAVGVQVVRAAASIS